MIRKKIPIGNRVIIVNPGLCYPTYEEMAGKLKATKWLYNKDPSKGERGIVVAHSPHGNLAVNIYLVDIGEYEILMEYEGIKDLGSGEWDD